MHATSTRLATLSATAVLLGAAACQADVESEGELAVTLLGNSNSGAVYRLPEGSILDVANSEFQDGFSLDGDATSVRLDLPVGDYDAFLLPPSIDGSWQLERLLPDGTFTPVSAVLLSPLPVQVSILPDTSTGVAFSFAVADAGTVTFSHGSLDVSFGVTETTATGAAFGVTALDLTASEVLTTSATPPELIPRLPSSGTSGIRVQVQATLASPFMQTQARQACALVDIGFAVSDQAGISDILVEAQGEQDEQRFCVETIGAGNGNILLFWTSEHVPTTLTFSDLSTTQLAFIIFSDIRLPAPVFDGTTLALDALAGIQDVPIFLQAAVHDPASPVEGNNWYNASLLGSATFSFTPIP